MAYGLCLVTWAEKPDHPFKFHHAVSAMSFYTDRNIVTSSICIEPSYKWDIRASTSLSCDFYNWLSVKFIIGFLSKWKLKVIILGHSCHTVTIHYFKA